MNAEEKQQRLNLSYPTPFTLESRERAVWKKLLIKYWMYTYEGSHLWVNPSSLQCKDWNWYPKQISHHLVRTCPLLLDQKDVYWTGLKSLRSILYNCSDLKFESVIYKSWLGKYTLNFLIEVKWRQNTSGWINLFLRIKKSEQSVKVLA